RPTPCPPSAGHHKAPISSATATLVSSPALPSCSSDGNANAALLQGACAPLVRFLCAAACPPSRVRHRVCMVPTRHHGRKAPMNPLRDSVVLLEVMAALRTPGSGCAWDIEQTFATIAPYTLEEAYEVADAISRSDLDDLRDELGDLLLQVVFHARMAQEAEAFDFADVVQAITEKLLRRHPHAFGGP